MKFSPLSYTRSAATNVYWDLQRPEELDPTFSEGMQSQYTQPNTYGREHIYEINFSMSISPACMPFSLRMMSSIAVYSLPFQSASNLAK
jgi:hypothetical protein